MSSVRVQLADAVLEAAHKSAMPRHFDPMLATPCDTPFSHDDWIFERKLDGIRLLVFRHTDHVELLTRDGVSRSAHFPELVDAFAHQAPRRFVLDGEVLAIDGGAPRLPRRCERADSADGIGVYFFAFDCPWMDGFDLRRVPLRERKRVLRQAFEFNGALRYTAHRNAEGEAFFGAACGNGWDGIMAKHAASPYRCGRSKRWLKLSCSPSREPGIGGVVDSEGSRHDEDKREVVRERPRA